jgi:hypothetical protein
MAGTPKFKIFNPSGEYVAACKYPEDAAALVDLYGAGSTIRDGHSKADVVWTEGKETQPASESYDFVGTTVEDRIKVRRAFV